LVDQNIPLAAEFNLASYLHVDLFVVSGLLGFLLFAVQPLYQAVIAEESSHGTRGVSFLRCTSRSTHKEAV
jgi:hypothetical protein